ncbi:MAG: prepilin-type N-terminal cleavage/methylation domain-containing protein [Succinivibrionaceae bacterium]|nr:prepilin-type N-terminal cleavage/methylation domain-containing protein [Succinivibrionaceae bacterium]
MKRNSGFTLIELMVVILVIAILAAIAVPAYGKYSRQAKRQDTETEMFKIQQDEEQYFSLKHTYFSMSDLSARFSGKMYDRACVEAYPSMSNPAPTASCDGGTDDVSHNYAIKAFVRSRDAGKDDCDVLILYKDGTKKSLKSLGGSETTTGCW